MDRRAGSGSTMRKFFSKKSGDEGSKPSFDMRSTLFRSDHLKSTSAKAAKTYKFFSSKNSSRSNSPSITNPSNVVNTTVRGVTKTVVKKTNDVTALQSSKSPRDSVRNGNTISPPSQTTVATTAVTASVTRGRKRAEPETENRENQSFSPSRSVSHSKASMDAQPKSPVKTRNTSPNTKHVDPPSPTKQSKRIRAKEPDPVDESVITGRRVTRSVANTDKSKPTTKSGIESVSITTPMKVETGSHSNGSTARGSNFTRNYTKKASPVKNTSSKTSSSQPSSSALSLPEEALQLPDSGESYQLPDPIKLIDDEDPLPPEPEWTKTPGKVNLASLFSSPTKSPQKPQISPILPPPPVEPEQPVVQAKPKKKFFTSRTASQKEETKKSKLDFKTFFKDDLDDSFEMEASSSQAVLGQTGTDDEYVTIQRIRKAHQCHESGETESFDEDIKYYLNGLEKTNPIRIRCLSIEALTQQCMGAEFRMHLRAHDDMPRIISALSDAPSNPNIAFCTAALMFVYNQDRLTMDIDPNHLSLMLDLLEVKDDTTADSKPLVDMVHSKKAKELVEQLKSRGHGKFLDPKHLTTGKMALEALLGLTSKRAGDWFKEELRNLKGLDFLMNTVISGIASSPRLPSEADLSKIDRTLRVLEAATFMHEVNQLYCINYQEGLLITSCIKLMKLCKDCIIINEDSRVHLSSMLSVLRVFTNITSESAKGSSIMGTRFKVLFDLFLDLLFEVPSFIPPDSRFDLMVLLLCLCINFVEFVDDLRQELLSSNQSLTRLVEILFTRVEEAKETEKQADDILETAEKEQMANEVINIDTLLNQVVAKSGKHMEHSIIAACVSLLLGCSVQDNPQGKDSVAKLLPDQSFDPLVDVLRKLHEFAHLAVS